MTLLGVISIALSVLGFLTALALHAGGVLEHLVLTFVLLAGLLVLGMILLSV